MKLKYQVLTLSVMSLLGSSAFAFTNVPAGSITTSQTWTVANSPYILQGQVFVTGAGTVLDIEPGTIIRGQPQSAAGAADAGSLIIRPEAKIQARGTAANPIIFTTAALDSGLATGGAATGIALGYSSSTLPTRFDIATNTDAQYLDLNPATSPLAPRDNTGGVANGPLTLKNTSMWGGLILVGDAPTNKGQQVDIDADTILAEANSDGFGFIEGIQPQNTLAIYGGVNSEHNGGILKYVSIRHGGAALSTGKELNALTLYSVGSKTTISYIDTYCSGDDGVEIFGGTVNLDHLNLNYCDDDGLDTDQGWQGLAQFVFVLQGFGYGDNGIEADGEDKVESNQATFGNPDAATPYGDQRIYNATVLLNTQAKAVDLVNSNDTGASNGARLRAGWAGQLVNSIIQNCSPTVAGQGLRIDGLKTTGLTVGETAEYGNSARTYFGLGLAKALNNTVVGFSANYAAFSVTDGTNTFSWSAAGAASGSTITKVSSPVVAVGYAVGSVYYPITQNATSTGVYPNYLIAIPDHLSAGGVNPRVKSNSGTIINAGNYQTTQNNSYVVSPAVTTAYRGAFDRSAATLWTFGWTALNKRGILAN